MRAKRCYLLLLLAAFQCAFAESVRLPDSLQLPASEQLRYIVSYQGILTLGLPVDIAEARLQLNAEEVLLDDRPNRHALLQVSTEPFPRMEAFYPLRFDYQSWFDPKFNYVSLVSIRKESSSQRHDLIWFDHPGGQVRTYRTDDASHLESVGRKPSTQLMQAANIRQAAHFAERRVKDLPQAGVLDRMGMLYKLRHRDLHPGQMFEFQVSNGKDLAAYRIDIEARDSVDLSGQAVAALRVLLVPIFIDGDSRGYQVRVWLSDDGRHLPLRFSSSKFGGTIELRLSEES